MEEIKGEMMMGAKARMSIQKRQLNLEKQDQLKKLKDTLIDKRPTGGSMIGESYQDYMLGGGTLQDIQEIEGRKASSFIEAPTFSTSPKNKE